MKTQKSDSFAAYFSQFPDDVQKILTELRAIVHRAAPDAVEEISYGMPTFKINGKPLVHFAAYEKHVGVYPTPSGIAAFKKEIKNYTHAKGSVQFQLGEPVPYDLFEKIVDFRVEEMS